MALKMSSFTILICVLISAMAVAPKAEAQLGIFNRLLGLLRIQGTVFCTANGQIGVNGTSTPVFPNAVVQLQCRNGSTVVSSATTSSLGVFSILLDPITLLLSALLQDCQLVVTTPLSTCNAALPAFGGLVSTLQPLGTTTIIGGFINITNIIPAGFRFVQNLNA